MNYTIEAINLHGPGIEFELRVLIKEAFKSADLVPEGYLIKNISSNASRPSFFLVAKENDKIMGCNGFIANDFLLDGKQYIGYQSCWSATHPEHQGKRVFVNIINEAKKILKEKNAGFLYGIPNNTSHPIFLKKLEFSETQAFICRIPNIPFLKNSFFHKKKISNSNALFIDEEQVKEHKLAQFPLEVKVIRHKDSWLWGKFKKKVKFGIKIPFFEIGGIHLNDETDLPFLINEIFRSHKVWFIQIISCQTNSFNSLVKKWKPASMNGFIYYNLSMPGFEHFNIMIGAIDVF